MATPTATGNTTAISVRLKVDTLAELQKQAEAAGKDTPDFLGEILGKVVSKELIPADHAGMDTFFEKFFFFLSNNYQFKAARDMHTMLKAFREGKPCPHDNI